MKIKTVFLAILITSSSAFASDAFRCAGAGNIHGTLEMDLETPYMSISGSFKMDDSDKKVKIICDAKAAKERKNFTYFNTTKSAECPFDYIRIPDNISEGNGQIALVNTSSGDLHDWSGYDYRYFDCALKQP